MGMFDFVFKRKSKESATTSSPEPTAQTPSLNTSSQIQSDPLAQTAASDTELAMQIKEDLVDTKRLPASLKKVQALAGATLPLNTQLAVILRRGEEVLATVSGVSNISATAYTNLIEAMNKNDGLHSLPISEALQVDFYEIPKPASGAKDPMKIWIHPRFESRGLTRKIQDVLTGASHSLKIYDKYEVASASKLGCAVFADVTQMYAYYRFAEKARSKGSIEALRKLIDEANGEGGICYVGYEPVLNLEQVFDKVPYLSEEEYETRDEEPETPWPFKKLSEGFYVHHSIAKQVREILKEAQAKKKAGDSGENSNSQQSAA